MLQLFVVGTRTDKCVTIHIGTDDRGYNNKHATLFAKQGEVS